MVSLIRNRWNILKLLHVVLILVSLSGCNRSIDQQNVTSPALPQPLVTSTPFQPENQTIFVGETVPTSWIDSIKKSTGLQLVDNPISAKLTLSLSKPGDNEKEFASFIRVYAAVVQFPAVNDSISIEELKGLWQGVKGKAYDHLLVSKESASVLQELWVSSPSELVSVMDPGELLDAAWGSPTSVAIIPFEEISPRWKVLKINGISPLDKPMPVNDYPMTIIYHLVGLKASSDIISSDAKKVAELIPATNRNESEMTVVVMSGTTALVRAIAYKIEIKGNDYPISQIKDWFLSADIRHVSNEVSINKDCPYPNPNAKGLQFCTNEKYLPVLQGLGINVIELTGNHLNDYGPEKLAETIEIYNQNGINYFGGGFNLEDAQKPLKMTINGNKIAFIGCNYAGPPSDFATDIRAGSAPCDMALFSSQISQLKKEGFVVFATFQYSEYDVYMYDEAYQSVFHDAANSGADIIQGSQAHYPMGFEFVGNSLIHYGLGNFLFDQMDFPTVGNTREFIDRHIIYNGRYINTELLTAKLTDWSKPVPMTEEQRIQFLEDIFTASKMR